MKVFLSNLFIILFTAVNAHAAIVADSTIYGTVVLEQGSIITLKLLEPVRSDEVEESTIIPAAVGLDVVSEGQRVAITGAYAEAKVRRVESAGRFGKGALLEIEAINVQLIDGQRIKLSGDICRATGKNRKLLAWTVAIVTPAVGMLFASSSGNEDAVPFMASFAGLGFLVKGKVAELEVGTLMTAVVTKDVEVQVE